MSSVRIRSLAPDFNPLVGDTAKSGILFFRPWVAFWVAHSRNQEGRTRGSFETGTEFCPDDCPRDSNHAALVLAAVAAERLSQARSDIELVTSGPDSVGSTRESGDSKRTFRQC